MDGRTHRPRPPRPRRPRELPRAITRNRPRPRPRPGPRPAAKPVPGASASSSSVGFGGAWTNKQKALARVRGGGALSYLWFSFKSRFSAHHCFLSSETSGIATQCALLKFLLSLSLSCSCVCCCCRHCLSSVSIPWARTQHTQLIKS